MIGEQIDREDLRVAGRLLAASTAIAGQFYAMMRRGTRLSGAADNAT
jgi:hypothetical protein